MQPCSCVSVYKEQNRNLAMAAGGAGHLSRVRVLYKAILRLHRGLPLELKAFGDQYAKDEFKRHRDCEAQFVPVFMNEWTVRIVFNSLLFTHTF